MEACGSRLNGSYFMEISSELSEIKLPQSYLSLIIWQMLLNLGELAAHSVVVVDEWTAGEYMAASEGFSKSQEDTDSHLQRDRAEGRDFISRPESPNGLRIST